jgi:hypothetical protein
LQPSLASQTCLNNGAAGLPNFAGSQNGVLTRIATRPYEGPLRCCGVHIGGVYTDALALHYGQAAWAQRSLAQWPEGSDAHTSYWARIQYGPPYTVGVRPSPPWPEREAQREVQTARRGAVIGRTLCKGLIQCHHHRQITCKRLRSFPLWLSAVTAIRRCLTTGQFGDTCGCTLVSPPL